METQWDGKSKKTWNVGGKDKKNWRTSLFHLSRPSKIVIKSMWYPGTER